MAALADSERAETEQSDVEVIVRAHERRHGCLKPQIGQTIGSQAREKSAANGHGHQAGHYAPAVWGDTFEHAYG